MEPTGKNKSVLIIEDETPMRVALWEKLSGMGINVLEADEGVAGLKKALELHPDLTMLDIILPKMSGITVLENLRKDTWGKDAKVVILTLLSDSEIIGKCKELGVSEFMVKSEWKIDEVAKRVKQILGV